MGKIDTVAKIIAKCQKERKDNDCLYKTMKDWETKLYRAKKRPIR